MDPIWIDPSHDALIVVDVQPDFMPGGALPVEEGDHVVAPIAAIFPYFSTIIATQDWHPKNHISFASHHRANPFQKISLYGQSQTLWPDHCVQGSKGAELHPLLPQEPISLILRKGTHLDIDSYSSFSENVGPDGVRRTTGLGALLAARAVHRVFLCGLALDICVHASALDAASGGFTTFIVEDLCRAISKKAMDLARIQSEWVNSNIRTIPSSLICGAPRKEIP